MAGVLVTGSLNLDMVITSPSIPGPGENVHGTGFTMVAGGKGANQAVAASRLGQKTILLGCVGADRFGDFLVESLETAGVSSSLVKRAGGASTGVALIVIEEGTGINTIVVDPGANMAMVPGDLDVLEGRYDDFGTALFQLEIPLDVVAEGARRARQRGQETVLDAGPPRGDAMEVAKLFDVVSPNDKELSSLTGREVRDLDTAVAAARELLGAGIKTVVVKLGSMGALLMSQKEREHLPAFEVEAVDTTGCGDAFTAALTVGLAEGMELGKAVTFANAAGAAAARVLGAIASMPTRTEVEAILAGGA